ncbi:MAG: inosine/xanthosine triphosphatase [Candidatus Bipolaricaulota bacterium]|nr:inosine/xanthosine triphosphatase [Candidatus Bipolaricaulota bacterium]
MKVNIGTNNSLKLEAVRAVFATAFPEDDIEVTGVNVPSGVPAQPFDGELALGALSRARAALLDADYSVGIEAGIVSFPGCEERFSVQFCTIVDQDGEVSVGHGPGYTLPSEVIAALKAGSDLNREMSRISGIDEIRDKIGAVGYLSKGITDRLTITRDAVLMALIPRIKKMG